MRYSHFTGYALAVCAAITMIAGCGGLQARISTSESTQQSAVTAMHRGQGRSWMLPEATSQNLLYVADSGSGGVLVFTYDLPQKPKFVGLLAVSAPYEECVDNAQDVFVTNGLYGSGSNVIYKYAHGGKSPIAILDDTAGAPVDCSVDPTTGNLAVTTQGPGFGVSLIALYKKATGRPKIYKDRSFVSIFNCSYDNKGNIFVVGLTNGSPGVIKLAELPKGGSTFKDIKLDQAFGFPGGLQWDGKYLAAGDSYAKTIYQFTISNGSGKKIGSTPLDGSAGIRQFFIAIGVVINPVMPPGKGGYVKFYKYPAGGTAILTLTDNVSAPTGAAVSLAK
jgi:hypothetical protein